MRIKPSRIPALPVPRSEPFGLFAIIESKRTILPLKGVECDFSVLSGVADVSMTQIFRQENEKPLDCEYLFPLPADASVYFCEADINGRTIRAQVRERQEARKLASEKKAAGHRTALVESERDNLFTLSLGNVQSGDMVVIRLKYFQTLRSLADMPSIEVPFCPGIRYIPGKPLLRSNKGKGIVDDTDEVPDASRITPVRIDGEHPDAAYIEVRGTLDGQFVDENEVSSPSHPVAVNRVGQELRVSLSDKGDLPDRDFVLRWKEKEAEAVVSRVWVQQKDKVNDKVKDKVAGTYALLEIRAPKEAPQGRAPVDFYFLVDRSGSMQGEKWNKAAEALLSCVKVLRPDDRVMVTFFESRFQDFAEGPVSAQGLLGDSRFQGIAKIGTDGGTELRSALKHVLDVAAKHSANCPRNLILITDAQIANEDAILELMKPESNFPTHCFGIDVVLNDSLLQALSRQQGGTFHSLNPRDDIQKAVTALGQTLGQPVLLDLKLSDGWEAADATIPNLYAGQIHYLSARCSKGSRLELTARSASLKPVKIRFEEQRASNDAPYLHWCKSRIARLMAEGKDKQAIALSTESNLICRLTAFIAWDQAEKVAVATHELMQPSMAPAWGSARFDAMPVGAAGATAHLCEDDRVSYCLSAPELDRSVATRKLRKLLGKALGRSAVPRVATDLGSAAADELLLKRELSEICHQAGVPDWQELVKAIFDWIAEANGDERTRRIEAVNKLVCEIRDKSIRSGETVGTLHQVLKAFVEQFRVRNVV
ncbi:MAG: hypothetical protein C5B50_10850 [Verrucomicrobia bacterium]|nr:MAG: hypothetical protein C5B50_10850 [Verrucomicrobiota bacterium]